MPKIKIINERTGEVQEIDCIGYNLQYAEATGDGKIQKIRDLKFESMDHISREEDEIYLIPAKISEETAKDS